MVDTEFLRSDELPAVALGYLTVDGAWRTNVFHLPVRGTGDGGIYTTVADVRGCGAFFAGRIVSSDWVEAMTVRTAPDGSCYGLGFWLHESSDLVRLVGSDARVSFRSLHDPATHTTCTVISNSTDGAWPVVRFLVEQLGL